MTNKRIHNKIDQRFGEHTDLLADIIGAEKLLLDHAYVADERGSTYYVDKYKNKLEAMENKYKPYRTQFGDPSYVSMNKISKMLEEIEQLHHELTMEAMETSENTQSGERGLMYPSGSLRKWRKPVKKHTTAKRKPKKVVKKCKCN